MKVRKEAITNRTGAAGLLSASGVFSQLKAACLTLVNSDPELIRSMMISVSALTVDAEVDSAVRRFAEEQCVEAEVERRGSALVIRLKRSDARPFGEAAR
jgi:hypothetical protein